MKSHRPELLFLTPVMPAAGGNGLAMRAGVFLEAFAPLFNVHLHVVPIFPSPLAPQHRDRLEQACVKVLVQDIAGREDPLYRMIAKIKDPRHRLAALMGYTKPLLSRYATEEAIADVGSRYAACASR